MSDQAMFTLSVGNYGFGSDQNGTPFWSGTVSHCAVPGCTSATAPMPVSVVDSRGGIQAGLPAYAFDGTTFTGDTKMTNANEATPSRRSARQGG